MERPKLKMQTQKMFSDKNKQTNKKCKNMNKS